MIAEHEIYELIFHGKTLSKDCEITKYTTEHTFKGILRDVCDSMDLVYCRVFALNLNCYKGLRYPF